MTEAQSPYLNAPKRTEEQARADVLDGVSLGKIEARALAAMADAYNNAPDFAYLPFAAIAQRGDIPRDKVRRAVRGLARKGLAEFYRGLMTECGDLAGSGYRCTSKGKAVASALYGDGYAVDAINAALREGGE